MTFDLDITQRIDGFTSLRSTVCDAMPRGGQAPYLASLTRPLGVEIYRRYTRELASALARFDPLSTAVIVDPGHRP